MGELGRERIFNEGYLLTMPCSIVSVGELGPLTSRASCLWVSMSCFSTAYGPALLLLCCTLMKRGVLRVASGKIPQAEAKWSCVQWCRAHCSPGGGEKIQSTGPLTYCNT